MNSTHTCLECGIAITDNVYHFSKEIYTFPLCFEHQRWIEESQATDAAIMLYFALKSNKVPVILEYKDGRKTIDIAVPGKLYIEVDGKYNFGAGQALSDLLENYHSLKENIPTIRIPNALIYHRYQFGIAVNRLTEMCLGYKQTG